MRSVLLMSHVLPLTVKLVKLVSLAFGCLIMIKVWGKKAFGHSSLHQTTLRVLCGVVELYQQVAFESAVWGSTSG